MLIGLTLARTGSSRMKIAIIVGAVLAKNSQGRYGLATTTGASRRIVRNHAVIGHSRPASADLEIVELEQPYRKWPSALPGSIVHPIARGQARLSTRVLFCSRIGMWYRT